MLLRELKITKRCPFPGIFMSFTNESLMEMLSYQNTKMLQNCREVVCLHLLQVQSVQADKTD